MAASTPFDRRWLVSVSTPFGEFCGRSHSKRRHNSGGQLLASDGWKAEPQCRIFGHDGVARRVRADGMASTPNP
jgi:hypothetical protein